MTRARRRRIAKTTRRNILGSADRATTLLAGEVVHVTRDPQRIKESFFGLLRFNTTVKDMVAVGVIPIESVVVKPPPIFLVCALL